jgi:hypothetical protein
LVLAVAVTGAHPVEAGKFSCGGVQADLEALDLAGPAVGAGLGYAVAQVVGDLDQAWACLWVDAQAGAADAGFSELWGRSLPKPLIYSSLKPNW